MTTSRLSGALGRASGLLRGEPYYRALPFRLVRAVRPEIRVRMGGASYAVSTRGPSAVSAATWAPSWRSAIMADLLAGRAGAFVDVGVNIGQTLWDLLAVDAARAYVGFDANPSCIDLVGAFVRRNGLDQCTLVPAGLSEAPELAVLHVSPDVPHDSTGTLVADLRPGRPQERRYVPCLPFDDAWDALGGGPVALVKVDVEGAELGVLRGMRRMLAAHRPPVLIEVLHAASEDRLEAHARWLRDLESTIEEAGYAASRIEKGDGAAPRLVPAERFPVDVWTPANAETCDYLLRPL